MKDTFDLKKYLVENKMTENSRRDARRRLDGKILTESRKVRRGRNLHESLKQSCMDMLDEPTPKDYDERYYNILMKNLRTDPQLKEAARDLKPLSFEKAAKMAAADVLENDLWDDITGGGDESDKRAVYEVIHDFLDGFVDGIVGYGDDEEDLDERRLGKREIREELDDDEEIPAYLDFDETLSSDVVSDYGYPEKMPSKLYALGHEIYVDWDGDDCTIDGKYFQDCDPKLLEKITSALASGNYTDDGSGSNERTRKRGLNEGRLAKAKKNRKR